MYTHVIKIKNKIKVIKVLSTDSNTQSLREWF